MNKPTAADYRLDTRIPWEQLGLPLQNPDSVLQSEIDDAWAYIEEKACRDLDALDETTTIGRLSLRAVKLRTVQQAVQGQGSFMNQALNNLIKSFSVPGYSETRVDPYTSNGKFMHSILNEWPVLADLIWTIMPEECREKLLALYLEERTPASAYTEHDWFWPSGIQLPGRYE